MKNILVTGATGNVGQPIVSELLNRGYTVTALVRRPTKLNGCRTIVSSLAEIHNAVEEISNADAIVHLANSRLNLQLPIVAQDILGTAILLEAWRKGNFVYASSQTVYGIPSREVLSEDSNVKPECWYDLGKICNEFQVQLTCREPCLERGAGVSLRLALLFGSGDRRNDRQYLSYVYSQCMRGSVFVFDSEECLDVCGSSYIGGRDLTHAVVDSLSLQHSGSYNVSGGFCTWRSLIALVDKYAGTRSRIVIRAGASSDINECRLPQSRSFLDISAFATRTGFSPAECVEHLVEEFVKQERNV